MEKEFRKYAYLYVFKVIYDKMVKYHQTLEQGKLRLPDFMRDDTPEKMAEKEVKELYINNTEDFWQLGKQELGILW